MAVLPLFLRLETGQPLLQALLLGLQYLEFGPLLGELALGFQQLFLLLQIFHP